MALVWMLHARAAQAGADKSQRALSSGDLSLHPRAMQRIDTRPLAAVHDASLQSCAGMPPAHLVGCRGGVEGAQLALPGKLKQAVAHAVRHHQQRQVHDLQVPGGEAYAAQVGRGQIKWTGACRVSRGAGAWVTADGGGAVDAVAAATLA